MKNLLLFATLLLAIAMNAQITFPVNESGIYTLEKVYEVPNRTQKELFDNAVVFFSKKVTPTFVSMQLKDEENFKLIAKSMEPVRSSMGNTKVYPTWDISFKDGKYKVILSNIILTHENRAGQSYALENVPKEWISRKKHINETHQILEKAMNDLFIYLKTDKNNDW